MGFFASLFYGLIGSAYLVYGKRQGETWFIFAGFMLLFFPYFITNGRQPLIPEAPWQVRGAGILGEPRQNR
jgi:hypothetical protein